MAITRIQKWGNSYGIRTPKNILDEMGLLPDTRLEIHQEQGKISIPPGVPIQGVILSDQIRSPDWRARRAERIGSLPEETIAQILERLKALLILE